MLFTKSVALRVISLDLNVSYASWMVMVLGSGFRRARFSSMAVKTPCNFAFDILERLLAF
jgi:hypothetical protein